MRTHRWRASPRTRRVARETAEGIRPALYFGDRCGCIVQEVVDGRLTLDEGLAATDVSDGDARAPDTALVVAALRNLRVLFGRRCVQWMDRFSLVTDVIDRVPGLAARASYVTQAMRDKHVEHRQYIERFGEDLPEVRVGLERQPRHVNGSLGW